MGHVYTVVQQCAYPTYPSAALGLRRDVLAAALDVGLLSLTLYKTTAGAPGGAPGASRGLSCASVIRSCSETMAALLGTPSPQDLSGCRLEHLVEHPRPEGAPRGTPKLPLSTVLYCTVLMYCTKMCSTVLYCVKLNGGKLMLFECVLCTHACFLATATPHSPVFVPWPRHTVLTFLPAHASWCTAGVAGGDLRQPLQPHQVAQAGVHHPGGSPRAHPWPSTSPPSSSSWRPPPGPAPPPAPLARAARRRLHSPRPPRPRAAPRAPRGGRAWGGPGAPSPSGAQPWGFQRCAPGPRAGPGEDVTPPGAASLAKQHRRVRWRLWPVTSAAP